MVWQGKRRKQLPRDWSAIRKQRLVLDGYRCTAEKLVVQEPWRDTVVERCTARATEVHHAGHPDDHRLEALRSLCHDHHQEHTQAEARAAQDLKPRKRPVTQHPGLK